MYAGNSSSRFRSRTASRCPFCPGGSGGQSPADANNASSLTSRCYYCYHYHYHYRYYYYYYYYYYYDY